MEPISYLCTQNVELLNFTIMMIENFEDSLKLATEFLPKKERKNYYEFKVIQEPFAEYLVAQNELSDEDVKRLHELKEKYQETFVEHLSEALDEDTIDDLDCGDELVDIDFDNVQHQYRFKVHHLKQVMTTRHACFNASYNKYCLAYSLAYFFSSSPYRIFRLLSA